MLEGGGSRSGSRDLKKPGKGLIIMKRIPLVMLAVICLSLSALAQTSPLQLKAIGDIEANKALKVL
jgi:hypothetical protein